MLVACSTPVESSPQPLPDSPGSAPIRESGPLWPIALQSITGKTAKVGLKADDEQVWVNKTLSSIGQPGDRMRRGHYAFYLQHDGSAIWEKSDLTPFGKEPLEFNDQYPGMIRVILGEERVRPDLLLISQYASSNGKYVAVLALSPDGKRLIHLPFRIDEKQKDYLFAAGIELIMPGRLRTSSYDNVSAVHTRITWAIQEDALVAISIETQ